MPSAAIIAFWMNGWGPPANVEGPIEEAIGDDYTYGLIRPQYELVAMLQTYVLVMDVEEADDGLETLTLVRV